MTTDNVKRKPLARVADKLTEKIQLPTAVPALIACGAETGNTFCISVDDGVYVSHDIGDLRDARVYDGYLESIAFYKKRLGVEPEVAVCDLHPDYVSTRYAEVSGADRIVAVQHHHAHAVACMYENGLMERTIAITFDGMGLGSDGTIWGGEFLSCDLQSFERKGHLKAYPLPGGDQATLYPERMAFSCLQSEFGPNSAEVGLLLPELDEDEKFMLDKMIEKKVNSPLASSAGRLFDAVSAMIGFTGPVGVPAEAAIVLQNAAQAGEHGVYKYEIVDGQLCMGGMFRGIYDDMRDGVEEGVIAAKFHNTLAVGSVEMCRQIRDEEGLSDVVLSGGVFYNALLGGLIENGLRESGFNVYSHKLLPPGDVCLSFGQAVIACAKENRLCV